MHPSLHSLGHTFQISPFCLNAGSSYLSSNDAANWGSNGEEGALDLILGAPKCHLGEERWRAQISQQAQKGMCLMVSWAGGMGRRGEADQALREHCATLLCIFKSRNLQMDKMTPTNSWKSLVALAVQSS